ncbi:MAG: phosphatase PAP2 family protein [Microscillaceae bacterium]|nr:phosphatase PAP2 family protein [Microscillaceae bacterium]MDW8461217.1 phosphatase PAP2 family protein [Cytophagales bacterium]
MIEYLLTFDSWLFLWLNAFHSPFWDGVMFALSRSDIWLPLYCVLVILIFLKYRHKTLRTLILICLVIVSADSFTSRVLKPYCKRLRPSHEPSLKGKVHIVYDYKGGLYGMASSHAANTFGLAMAMYLLFPKQRRYRWLFLWASVVSYSRIYLGVHYPLDILVGAGVGTSFAWLWVKLFQKAGFKVEHS